ncbi:MAG: zinc-binding dehydrogenase [Planctomycetaceae bacterium]|nr:zinc-binding dehydrogenase [Planctomycetaceae bacterium]
MKTTAAVLVTLRESLELIDLEIPALKPGQVLVEIRYSGVCHTQLMEWQGQRGEDRFLPHCLGHEGSGTIIDVGPNIKKCRPGDKVILSWMKGHGADVPGTQYRCGQRTVNAGGITTFMRHAILSENRVTPLVEELSATEAAFLGCAVATGLGSVKNTLNISQGSSVLVIGLGGIGLFAVAGAKFNGANPIIAADINDQRLSSAKNMGATHLLNVKGSNLLKELQRICPGGVSYAIEATGQVNVMQQALSAVKPRGGAVAIIGNAAFGQTLSLDPSELNQGKKLFGTWGGDNHPDDDFLTYQRLFAEKKLSADALRPTVYSLENINQALIDFHNRSVTRPLIDMQMLDS